MKKGVPHGWAFMQEYAGKGLLMLLFFLFVFLKPFYLQSSGNVGSADVCLAACFVLLLGQKCLREWRGRHWKHVFCRKQGQKMDSSLLFDSCSPCTLFLYLFRVDFF